jgi:DNA phosphorothioation-associated putative methyltransferase
MDFPAYKRHVNELPIGKKLPDAVYLHQSYLSSMPTELANFVDSVATEYGNEFDWNVLKLYRRDFKVTLLAYPTFDDESYPALQTSLTIDLVRAKVRKTNFSRSNNPPILHRKEALVPSSHENYTNFVQITEEGEKAGLYENSRKIGFLRSWERTITQKGYALIDGRIVRRNDHSEALAHQQHPKVNIQRHLTAVDRDKLSTPMQSLARHGYLDGDHSILDYGCGKGHDLLELEAHGLDAAGWDPAYRPDGDRQPSDIVNLGFVINVIEDRQERAEVLRKAYALTNQLLVVSVMLGGEATIEKFTPYKDGVVTSRGTFQKYYTQAELRDFIEASLDTKAVAIGPGQFYVFKDALEEQEFLVRRQRIKREWKHLTQRDRLSPSVDYQVVIEKNLELFKSFWNSCLDFGRTPANDEFDRSDELRRVLGSHRKAISACIEYFGSDDFEAARLGRKKDLTVFLALSFFDRHRAYSHMPISLQRDVRAFFEKPAVAYDFAEQALFAISDTEMIDSACRNATTKLQCGLYRDGSSLTIDSSLIDQLPPILRIYIGCSTQLFGDLEEVDLIKIHIGSGKVSLLTYDDFAAPIPLLRQRVKIDMRKQAVDVFSYPNRAGEQPLYFKSTFLTPIAADYPTQRQLDSILKEVISVDDNGIGPTLGELRVIIQECGLDISV